MKKVLFITGELSRTFGTGEYLYNLMNCLGSRGFTIYVATKEVHQNINIHVQSIALPSTFLNFLKTLRVILKLLEIVKRNHINVIHVATHSCPNLMLSLPVILLTRISDAIAGRRRTKVLVAIHDRIFVKGSPHGISEWALYLLIKLTIIFADLVIVPGESIREALLHMFGKRAYMKSVVLPVCVAEDVFFKFYFNKYDSAYVRRKYNLPVDAFIMSFFGSMDFKPNLMSALWLWKNSPRICEEFRRKYNKQIYFVVAGRYSERLPRNECLVTLGYVEDLAELFALSDAIIIPHFPSHSGPHVKTLYALSSHKPLIVTVDGLKDFPEEIKKCVSILDPMDAISLATLTERVLINHDYDKVDIETCTDYLYRFFLCSKLCNLYYRVYELIVQQDSLCMSHSRRCSTTSLTQNKNR